MNKIRTPIGALVLAATALAAAALGGTSSAASQKAPKGTLVSIHKTALGNILADARGHTLYLFEKDKNRMSSCNGACIAYWPAVLTGAITTSPLVVLAYLEDTTRGPRLPPHARIAAFSALQRANDRRRARSPGARAAGGSACAIPTRNRRHVRSTRG